MFDYTNTKYNSFVKEQCAKLCTTIAGIFPNEHFYLFDEAAACWCKNLFINYCAVTHVNKHTLGNL